MSPLTKIFVVLLVVLSIVSSAAFVTYVNTVEDARKAAETANQALALKNQEAENYKAAAEDATRAATENFKTATAQIEQMKQARDAANKFVADRDAELAKAQSQLALQSADLSRLTEALKSSEDTKSKLQDMAASLRTTNDTMTKQNAEQSMTISDLTNKLEVTERERRFLAEQFAEAQNQSGKLGKALKDMGGNVASILETPTGLAGGAPPINGVVRATRTIAGIPYATISVGSADSVMRGMEFKVVDRDSGKFLGVLTVDSVEPNEATGRLDGPAIADVRAGVEVRTQL
ncbi:MAG TPA: hypothetical protein PLD59_09630 [Tepidisphaeraceae bacterium]|nr:hypothetical protein [Tepidisphaeraceae bacterium]